jgi:hypothetical protein
MPSKFKDDERFRHVTYHETDLRKTFARIRREMADTERIAAAARAAAHTVTPIKRAK